MDKSNHKLKILYNYKCISATLTSVQKVLIRVVKAKKNHKISLL